METLNYTIKSKTNISLKESLFKANMFVKMNKAFFKGFILIDCPDICDLFIIENRKVRQCDDHEWGCYYREYILKAS